MKWPKTNNSIILCMYRLYEYACVHNTHMCTRKKFGHLQGRETLYIKEHGRNLWFCVERIHAHWSRIFINIITCGHNDTIIIINRPLLHRTPNDNRFDLKDQRLNRLLYYEHVLLLNIKFK